jgi:hypothetical protein
MARVQAMYKVPFLTLEIDGAELPVSHSGCITHRETGHESHSTDGWVGARADLDIF